MSYLQTLRLFSLYKLASIIIISASSAFGQNLVVNPSFETAGNLQCSWYTTRAQYAAAAPGWTTPTEGSPDIFSSTLGNGCYSSTTSTHADNPGQQAPRTGQRYTNVVVYGSGGCTPYREYIEGSLTSALQVGTTYEVEMYVSLGDKATVATSNIGVKFGTARVYVNTMCVNALTPDVVYTGPPITDFTNWTRLVFYYTPTVANQLYFMIGNFTADNATCTQTMPGGTKSTIRYYIDDVSVRAVDPLTIVEPGVTNANVNLCNAASNNLFTHLIGNNIPTNGTWSGPSVLTGGHLGTYNLASNTPGVYTYTWGATGGPCSQGGVARVTVSADLATISINPLADVCSDGSIVPLTATPTGGTWSGTGVDGSNFNPVNAGIGSHTLTYTVNGACGGTQTTNINVVEVPVVEIDPVMPLCLLDDPITLNASSTVQGVTGTWSGTGVDGSIFSPQNAGIGSHEITYTLGGLCPSTTTIQITVNEVTDATINPVQPVCIENGVVNLTALFPGGIWSGVGVVQSTFDPQVVGVGSHTITYSIGGNCPDEKTTTIVVSSMVDATINPLQMMCFAVDPVLLTAVNAGGTWSGVGVEGDMFNPQVAGVGTHVITYTLNGDCPSSATSEVIVNDVGDATINTFGMFCMNNGIVNLSAENDGGEWSGNGVNGSTFNPEIAGVGTHIITYTIGGNCPDEQTTSLVVLPVADATITPVEALCENENSIILSAAQQDGVWSGNGLTGNSFNPIDAGVGTHIITYTIEGECPDEQSIQIVVKPMPVLNPIITPNEGCAPLVVNFSANVTPGATNEWKMLSIIHEVNNSNFFDTISATGCFDVRYTENLDGCSSTILLNDAICVGLQPVAEFLPTLTIQEVHQSEFYMNNLSTNADTYSWSYAPIGSSSEIHPSIVIPVWMEHVEVCLEAKNNNSCKDEVCKLIRAEEMLIYYVPNTFTPDGDEFNQTFQPVFNSGFDAYDFTMLIYNRWGEIVFETKDAKIGWDGTYNGIIQQPGTYTYRIEFKTMESDERKLVVGHVNLLK